jgi:RNA polymerase sigma-70 factor (ECF subfamily)
VSAEVRIDADSRDEVSLAAVARGDTQALAEIYDRHATTMLRVALRFLRNRQDAEDLLHDVFVEVWGKAADYRPGRGSVRRWLLMRVRSRAIDRLRSLESARRHAMAEARDREPNVSPCSGWDRIDRERARRALRDLPEAQRTLVLLSYFEGLSGAEMAERCDVPIGTVKSRLSAAIGKLRRSLAAPGGMPS